MRIERHPAGYNYRDRLKSLTLLRIFEGGAVYGGEEAGKLYVVVDEGTMADFLDDDDGLVQLIEFDSQAERDDYLRERAPGRPVRRAPTDPSSAT